MKRKFNTIKKSRKKSKDIDEKIEYLNKECQKTGLQEVMTTSNIYVKTKEVPNTTYTDFQNTSIGGYALALSGADGNGVGGAIIGTNSSGVKGVALSPPHPITGERTYATHLLDGIGTSHPLQPGKTVYRGFNVKVPTTLGGALWFFDSNYNFAGQQGIWLNFEWFNGGWGFWDTGFLGFNFHNQNLDQYELNGVNIGTQIKNQIAGINFGNTGVVGTPTTTVFVKNDLGDPGFLPINIDLSKQAFDFLKNKAQGFFNKGKDAITALGDFAVDPLGSTINFVKNDLINLYDKFSDTTISNDVLEPTFEKFGQILGSKTGFVLGIVTTAANDIRSYIGGKQSDFGDKPAFSSSNNPFAYAANLAMSLSQSIGNGRPVVMDNSVVSSKTVAQNITVDDIIMMHETNQTPQNGMPNIGMGVDDILNPNKDGVVKKPYMGDGFGGEGGSIMTPFIDNKGKLAISNVGDKVLRLGGESGEGFDINTQTFTDIPSSGNASGIAKEMVESGKFADGLTKMLNQQTNDANYNSSIVNGITNQVVDSPAYQNLMTVLDNDTIGGSFLSGSSTGAVNGAAGGALLYNQIKLKLGLMKPTDLQNAGGFGHVRRETIINVNDLNSDVKSKLYELYGVQESFSISVKSKTSLTEAAKLGHFEPEALTVDLEKLRKGIMPEFPKDPPPEMIGGYSAKSKLVRKEPELPPFIKVTKKDLAQNHKLTDKEISDFMNDVKMINDYIKKNPAELKYAMIRYPKDDPRLAQLNFNMDQMKAASDEYMDTHFPENQKLFNKLQDKIIRNIKQTDPKNFKGHKEAPKFTDEKTEVVEQRKRIITKHFKKKVILKKLFRKA